MPQRPVPLVKNELYHIYNRTIAEFVIFNCDDDYERIVRAIAYCSMERPPCSFRAFKIQPENRHEKRIVDIIAYCIMPTHPHLILKGSADDSISRFMHRVENSYSKYFNMKHRRKGPLWESRFKNVAIKTDEQLLHTTRYIHLNPVTAYIVNRPEEWKYSSYGEYIARTPTAERICHFAEYLDMTNLEYSKFVTDHIDRQRELAAATVNTTVNTRC